MFMWLGSLNQLIIITKPSHLSLALGAMITSWRCWRPRSELYLIPFCVALSDKANFITEV